MQDYIIGTFTFNELSLASGSFNIVNQDLDDNGYLYYVTEKGEICYADEGTFEPLIKPQESLPEEDGWGIVDTLTDEDK